MIQKVKLLIRATIDALVVVFLAVLIYTLMDSAGSDFGDPRVSIVIAGIAVLVAGVVMLVWAVPVHLLLSKFKCHNIIWYLIAAVIPGIVFVCGFRPFGDDTRFDLMVQAVQCSAVGVIAMLPFWYRLVYRNNSPSVVRVNKKPV